MANNDTLKLIIGSLLGGSGSGAAVALIGKEGYWLYGLVVFIFCVSAAVCLYAGLYVFDKKVEEKERKSNMKLLNKNYMDCFGTTGEFLFLSLQGKPEIPVQEIFGILAGDLRTRAENQKEESKELNELFSEGINKIATRWEKTAEKGISTGAPPKK